MLFETRSLHVAEWRGLEVFHAIRFPLFQAIMNNRFTIRISELATTDTLELKRHLEFYRPCFMHGLFRVNELATARTFRSKVNRSSQLTELKLCG